MFRIKICGITNSVDARTAAEAGADAIGVNFYESSPRYVERRLATEILAELPAGVAKVGVFVNAPSERVCETFDHLGLDWIQLHGDEPPEYLDDLGDRPVIRTLGHHRHGLDHALSLKYLERCKALARMPRCVLVDACVPGEYGGTGKAADWSLVAALHQSLAGVPLVLAGGLTPDNVARAISQAKPAAVDVASGVERSPGRKDPQLVARFVSAATEALRQVERG